MTDLPEPLVAAEVDLQDFPYMPLQVARLRDSDWAAEASDGEFRAAIMLWCAAWHQVPAGSLPDNDNVLMKLAGLGRDLRTWKKVRAGALHKFVKCSDGRLYHSVVAEQVSEAWESRLKQRHRTYCAAVRKHNERHAEEKREIPDFETWKSQGQPNRVAYDSADMSHGQAGEVTRDNAPCHTPVTAKTAPTEAKRSEAKGSEANSIPKEDQSQPSTQNAAREIDDPVLGQVLDAAGFAPPPGPKLERARSELVGWLDGGFDLDLDILPAIGAFLAEHEGTTNSLQRFTAAIRSHHAHRVAQPSPKPPPRNHKREALLDGLKALEPDDARSIRARLKLKLGAGHAGTLLRDAVLRIDREGWLNVHLPYAFIATQARDAWGLEIATIAAEVIGKPVQTRFHDGYPEAPEPVAQEAGCG